MTIMETLRADYLAARKARSTVASNLLSTLVGEATAIGKNNGNRETADEEALAVIRKFIKNAEESHRIVSMQDNASNKASILREEITILSSYLPQQMSAEDLTTAIKTIIAETSGANMGTVMATLKAKYAGKYDGKAASSIAKEALA